MVYNYITQEMQLSSFSIFHCLAFLMLISCGGGEAANILVLTPLGSKSHKNLFMGVAEAIAERGHQVTIVSTHKSSTGHPNLRDVILTAKDAPSIVGNLFKKDEQVSSIKNMMLGSPELCIKSLSDQKIQDLKNEKFDLVILSMFLDYCYMSLAHHFQAPLVHASPAFLISPMAKMVGSVHFSSFHKSEVLASQEKFPYSFITRFVTALIDICLITLQDYYLIPQSDRLCREGGLCPLDMPYLGEIAENASLTLVTRVKTLESPPAPIMPNVIYIGGIHCHPANPLPQDLEEWASSAEHGFIFFSLGSVVKTKEIPERNRKLLLRLFGSLKQRVLWKFDQEAMPETLPSNVRIGKWLPQQDLLGHKNIKLFITHGGMLSTMEASYHGVPIIGMPVMGDQMSNIDVCVKEGWASRIDWEDLNEEVFREAIHNAMDNQNYKDVVMERSRIMKDMLVSPAHEMVYWLEYVLRHKGAAHIKSQVMKLYTYELYNIDVWAALIGIVLAFCFLLKTFFSLVFRMFCKSSKTKRNKRKKD